jgi:hypothetical protein
MLPFTIVVFLQKGWKTKTTKSMVILVLLKKTERQKQQKSLLILLFLFFPEASREYGTKDMHTVFSSSSFSLGQFSSFG